jgi:hypothetical protein
MDKKQALKKINILNILSGIIVISFGIIFLVQNIFLGNEGVPFWAILLGFLIPLGVIFIGYEIIKRKEWALAVSGLLALGILIQMPFALKFTLGIITENGNIFGNLIPEFFITPVFSTIVLVNSFVGYPFGSFKKNK